MGSTKKMKTFGFEAFLNKPIVHCKAFEDNSGPIDLERLPKIFPFTKQINVLFHQLRKYAHKGLIHIQQVSTNDQCDDTRTKPFPQIVFLKHLKINFGF